MFHLFNLRCFGLAGWCGVGCIALLGKAEPWSFCVHWSGLSLGAAAVSTQQPMKYQGNQMRAIRRFPTIANRGFPSAWRGPGMGAPCKSLGFGERDCIGNRYGFARSGWVLAAGFCGTAVGFGAGCIVSNGSICTIRQLAIGSYHGLKTTYTHVAENLYLRSTFYYAFMWKIPGSIFMVCGRSTDV